MNKRKFNRILILLVYTLVGCRENDKHTIDNNQNISMSDKSSSGDTQKNKIEKFDIYAEGYDYKYVFSQNSISQVLYIKKGANNTKNDAPDILKYRLIVDDGSGNNSKKVFEGVADLISANESFSDEANPSEGDYFAADYSFIIGNCKLKLRIDVDGYEACKISTTCSNLEKQQQFPLNVIFKKVEFNK